jgi:hypothetical protein
VKTTILRILYAGLQAAPAFAIVKAAEDFRAIAARAGLSLAGPWRWSRTRPLSSDRPCLIRCLDVLAPWHKTKVRK